MKKPAKQDKAAVFAALKALQDRARDRGDFDRFEAIERDLAAVIAAEGQKYPHHFLKSREQKARLLLSGSLEGSPRKLTRHHFPDPGSFLEYECRWALVEVLRSENPPKDILQQAASLFVPDDGHPLAHPHFIAAIRHRRPGPVRNVYAKAQIVEIVATAKRERRGVEAGIQEAMERYGLEREYVYRVWVEVRGEHIPED
ncbi:hypothetical protein [Mesorhizobium sp.]|uniref:hypothetical protein n=1 Tax=Mesorhizobium sp. TaxID=1871066 RepID=UPI0011FB9DD1|nr:hypothetical protein [Mesorhizobium sp.]TIL49089.1 MAG: hypothetical protein E5Y83_28220 [Mesorhizobium sp.]